MISAEAPSNIALIKYMGKNLNSASANVPTNGSLSLTLPKLRSRVELVELVEDSDCWQSLASGPWAMGPLSDKGLSKFLGFFQRLKKAWGVQGNFMVRSGNNFPSDCGIASSASSFAALTLATYKLAQSQNPELDLTQRELAEWSRQGSGSSCRSFGGPFVEWAATGVRDYDFPLALEHEVWVLETQVKMVSSSQAHLRVLESSMFPGRVDRAEKRLENLKTSLSIGDWNAAWSIVWDEFWDMHLLFMSSAPPFQYMTAKGFDFLSQIRQAYVSGNDVPLVTMDAGANMHLVYRKGQARLRPQDFSLPADLLVLKGLES